MALSLLLTVLAWRFTSDQVQQQTAERFEREARQVVSLIDERLRKYEDALNSGVAAMYAGSNEIDEFAWKRFADALKIDEKYPGINGIGVIFHVTPEALPGFIAVHREKQPGFSVHPPHDINDFWPITYIEPVEPNRQAVGLDMAHEANRYAAARLARDTGRTTITAPIVLVQDSEQTPGFLQFVPFYRPGVEDSVESRQAHFVGHVYAPFIMRKLMEGTLEKTRRHVGVRISDPNGVLYDEHVASDPDFDPDPRFTKTVARQVFNREWAFDIRSKRSFNSATETVQPIMILLGGLTIDGLLLALFVILTRSNKRAVDYADRMLERYRRQESQLAEIEGLSSSIIENAADGLITFNEHGVIEQYNPACEAMFGYPKREVVGHSLEKLFPDADVADMLSRLADDSSVCNQSCCEFVGRRLDRRTVPIEATISSIDLGGKTRYTLFLRDITERKRVERMTDEFVSTVNHELRTPLTSIKGAISLLAAGKVGSDETKSRHLLRIASDGCERVTEIVNDILDADRIASGRMEYRLAVHDIAALTHEVIEQNFGFAAKFGVSFKSDIGPDPVLCRVDATRFSQAVGNLLSNAAKFSHVGGEVQVSLQVERGREAVLSVRDRGVGIPENFRRLIFTKFARAENGASRDRGGSGLGLSITRHIVEAFDGRIDYSSTEGIGTTFRIHLPLVVPVAA